MLDPATFNQADFNIVLQNNIHDLTLYKKTSENPKAVLLGGQSGAGKTTIHRIMQKKFNKNIIIIDGDSYRTLHPNYKELLKKYGKDSVKYTQAFAGKMVEAVVEELSKRHYNLLVEGTLRTVDVPKKTASLLKSRGYCLTLAVLAVKPELSFISTLVRYEEQYFKDSSTARFTPRSHHDGIVKNIVKNLRTLETWSCFDNIEVYTRDEKCVYSKLSDNNISAADVENKILFGKWTLSEYLMLISSINYLRKLRKKNILKSKMCSLAYSVYSSSVKGYL